MDRNANFNMFGTLYLGKKLIARRHDWEGMEKVDTERWFSISPNTWTIACVCVCVCGSSDKVDRTKESHFSHSSWLLYWINFHNSLSQDIPPRWLSYDHGGNSVLGYCSWNSMFCLGWGSGHFWMPASEEQWWLIDWSSPSCFQGSQRYQVSHPEI